MSTGSHSLVHRPLKASMREQTLWQDGDKLTWACQSPLIIKAPGPIVSGAPDY